MVYDWHVKEGWVTVWDFAHKFLGIAIMLLIIASAFYVGVKVAFRIYEGQGTLEWYTKEMIIANNHCEGNEFAGIQLDVNAASYVDSLIIEGNIVKNNDTYGLDLWQP